MQKTKQKMSNGVNQRGYALIFLLVIGGMSVLLISGLLQIVLSQKRLGSMRSARTLAFHIAEAGIDYYRWHLAHAKSDFTDGNEGAGPFIHPYFDRTGVRLGEFRLTITPPPLGSTLVTIESTGVTDQFPEFTRTVRATFAIPSLAKYSFVGNERNRFGSGTNVYGPIHVNGGVRFDGVAYNLVTSEKDQYNDTDSDDCTPSKLDFGVHTCVSPADPTPPSLVPNRPDVFKVGRKFPVPKIDLDGLITDLRTLRDKATAGGIYLAPPSNALGYHLIFNSDDTVSMLYVTKVYAPPSKCVGPGSQPGWGLWSINSETFIKRQPLPENGVIFVESDAWVDGQIDSARVTVAAARLGSGVPQTSYANIIVNRSLQYTNTDGRDVLALIAQNNILTGLKSNTTIRIDAALVAKNGRVGRFYYSSYCGAGYVQSDITLYGMIATNKRYGFSYTDGTGYRTRTLLYDGNLFYNPPPSFPLTADSYTLLTWEEIK